MSSVHPFGLEMVVTFSMATRSLFLVSVGPCLDFICLLFSWSLGDAWTCPDTIHYLAIPEVVGKK